MSGRTHFLGTSPRPAVTSFPAPPRDVPEVVLDAVRRRVGTDLRHGLDRDVVAAANEATWAEAPLLDDSLHDHVVRRVVAEINGLGQLEALLADPEVTEIMVNSGTEVWVEQRGALTRAADLPLGALDTILERILRPLGRRLDRVSPIVDGRLPDGSRVCAAIPPVAPDGACLSIRRFAARTMPLTAFGSSAVAGLLRTLLAARCNVVVSGATSSGKTTLLNALLAELPPGDRVITIEDTTELCIATPNTVRLEARDATADGLGGLALDDLLRAALRLRPDRLVVGEVRGREAVVLVQALSTGHDGSLATVHANGPADALRRLEAMVLQGSPSWPLAAVRELLHASVDVIVHVARGNDGRRWVAEVGEVAADALAAARVRPVVHAGVVCGELSRTRAGA